LYSKNSHRIKTVLVQPIKKGKMFALILLTASEAGLLMHFGACNPAGIRFWLSIQFFTSFYTVKTTKAPVFDTIQSLQSRRFS